MSVQTLMRLKLSYLPVNPRHSKDRQHFVQKVLLSKFTSTPDQLYEKQRIWIYDKQQQKSFPNNLANTAIQKKFLVESADDLITQMENECFPIITRIIQKECVMCTHFSEQERLENLFFLYRYIGYQIYRTPTYRNEIAVLKYWRNKNSGDIRQYQSELFQQPNFIFMDFDLTGKSRAVPDSRKNIAQMYYFFTTNFSKIPLNQADDLAASLFDILMPILLVNQTNIPFITNDVGLSWYFPIGKFTVDLQADGQTIQSWLAFPISPTLGVFLCTTKSLSIWLNSIKDPNRGLVLNTIDKKTVNLINMNTFRLANRFVFSSVEINPKYESTN